MLGLVRCSRKPGLCSVDNGITDLLSVAGGNPGLWIVAYVWIVRFPSNTSPFIHLYLWLCREVPGLGGLRAEPDIEMHLGRFFSAWLSGRAVKEQAIFSVFSPLSLFLPHCP